MDNIIDKFVLDQLSVWPMAASNFRDLKNVETRSLEVGGLEVRLQHNPARIRSSAAKVDKASLQARKCFLAAKTVRRSRFRWSLRAVRAGNTTSS